MRRKNIIIAGAALLAAIAIFLGVYSATRPGTTQGMKTITVTVVHGDETAKTFTYRTEREYLGQVLRDEGLVQGEEGPYGLYVTTVDGETADYSVDGSYWALYEGTEYAAQSMDQTPIADGDSFSLVYTV